MKGKRKITPLTQLIPVILILLPALLLLPGCEQVFTYSPLSFLARDPSTLPMEQRVSYAQLALASGDKATLQAAYESIASSTDPEVQYLASQVAVGASGLNEAIAGIDDFFSLTSDDVDAILGTIDSSWADNIGDSLVFAIADGGVSIAPEDKVVAAAMYVIASAESNSDTFPAINISEGTIGLVTVDETVSYIENPLDADDYNNNAAYFIYSSGLSLEDLESMTGLIGG